MALARSRRNGPSEPRNSTRGATNSTAPNPTPWSFSSSPRIRHSSFWSPFHNSSFILFFPCSPPSPPSNLVSPCSLATRSTTRSAALKAVSARFDKETRRTLARTVDFTQESKSISSMKRTASWSLANQTCSEVSMRGEGGVTGFGLAAGEGDGFVGYGAMWRRTTPKPQFHRRPCVAPARHTPSVFVIRY